MKLIDNINDLLGEEIKQSVQPGARLKIRLLMTAEILRHNKKPKLNITLDKDRDKDVESAPWFKVFKGERINDHHIARAEKQVAHKEKE